VRKSCQALKATSGVGEERRPRLRSEETDFNGSLVRAGKKAEQWTGADCSQKDSAAKDFIKAT
jgi:hypothetical protein